MKVTREIKQNNVLEKMLAKANKILSIIGEDSDNHKRDSILRQTKEMLSEKIFKQVADNIADSLCRKENECIVQTKKLLRHFNEVADEILSLTRNPKIEYIVQISQDPEMLPKDCSLLKWKLACMSLAYHYLLEEQNKVSFLHQIFPKNHINLIENAFLDSSMAMCLKNIEAEITLLESVQKDLTYIQDFKGSIGTDEKWHCLSLHIINVCTFVANRFKSASCLIKLEIEKIYWKHKNCKNSKKPSLTVSIDNIDYTFNGLTATTLYLALQDPNDDVEYEDAPLRRQSTEFADKQTYDALYRRIEDINIQLLIEYFAYHLADLLIRTGYSYKINPKYADLIEPY